MTNKQITSSIPWWTADAIRDEITDVFWVTGGLGSGKSYGSAIWFLERALRNQNSKFSWAVAPTHSKVRDILIPTFHEVLATHFGKYHGKDYETFITKPPKLVFFKSGHEIHFHSGARPDLMVGTNISHYLVTEVGFQKQEVFDKCQARTRCPKAKTRQGMLEGTPEGDNWYCEKANFDEYDETNKARRFKLHTSDNTRLPSDYIDKLKRTYSYDPTRLQSYLYGDFVPFTKGTAYWEFLHSRNVVLDVKPSKHLPLLLCWDFNKSPLAWVVMQRQPFERGGYRYFRFVALAESSGKSRGVLDACAEFIAQFDPKDYRDTPVHVYGDCSGYFGSHLASSDAYDQINQALRSRYRVSILAARSAPSIEARLNRVNTLMAYEQYVVAAWCRNLIKSHTNTGLKKGMWQIEKPSGEDWTHYSDATGYPLFQLTREEDLEAPNKPRIFGTNLN